MTAFLAFPRVFWGGRVAQQICGTLIASWDEPMLFKSARGRQPTNRYRFSLPLFSFSDRPITRSPDHPILICLKSALICENLRLTRVGLAFVFQIPPLTLFLCVSALAFAFDFAFALFFSAVTCHLCPVT
jgi:hypothetical protein